MGADRRWGDNRRTKAGKLPRRENRLEQTEGKQKRLAKEQVVLGPDSKGKSALVRVFITDLIGNYLITGSTGHLRISEDGIVELSSRARMDYGASIPPRIVVPDFTNREFLRWRWDNYNGI